MKQPGKKERPPRKIYLQWEGTDHPSPGEVDESEVTWCRDRIFATDVVYVRPRKRRKPCQK